MSQKVWIEFKNDGYQALVEENVNQSVVYFPYAEYYSSTARTEQVKICQDSSCWFIDDFEINVL